MTRAEADALVSEYDDVRGDYLLTRRRLFSGPGLTEAFNDMNAVRERLIDRLCGEEATQPLAGNAP